MRKKISAIAIKSFALLLVLGTAHQAVAQPATTPSTTTPYAKMAPVDQYLMADQAAEIALARSCGAGVHFTRCRGAGSWTSWFRNSGQRQERFRVYRGAWWTSAADADFWNPKVRVPMCVNAAAARSYLLRVSKWTDMGLAGRTPAQINEAIAAAIASKELPPMEPGAMCYMMSKEGYYGDSSPPRPSHLMFFYTDADLASWGANLPGSPVVGLKDPVEHLTQFVIPVGRWSDGTEYHEGSVVEHQH